MLWIGIILVVIGAILFVLSQKTAGRVYHMKATQTSKVGDLLRTVSEIAADMPDGKALGYSDYVEIKGQLVAANPVIADLSKTPSAIAEIEVTHVFEEYRETRDSQGRVSGSWSRSSETMSRDRQETVFEIDDGTGRLRVKPGKGTELTRTKEEFQPANSVQNLGGGQSMISFGGLQVQFGGGVGGGGPSGFGAGGMRGRQHVYAGQGFYNSNQRRTLGYRFVEKILPLGRHTYALGEIAVTEDEGVVLRVPTEDTDKKRPFMLAAKTEEELIKGANKKALTQKIIGGVLGVGGLVLIALGLAG